jgi:hypothetical protein
MREIADWLAEIGLAKYQTVFADNEIDRSLLPKLTEADLKELGAGYELAEDVRYNERTAAERVNARLKDEFGGHNVRVRGPAKVLFAT